MDCRDFNITKNRCLYLSCSFRQVSGGPRKCVCCGYLFTGVAITRIDSNDTLYCKKATLGDENITSAVFMKNGNDFLIYHIFRYYKPYWLWCFLDKECASFIQVQNRVVIRTMQKRFLYRKWKKRLIRHRLRIPRLSIPLTYLAFFLR